MKKCRHSAGPFAFLLCTVLLLRAPRLHAEPAAAALAAFNSYCRQIEARLATQHRLAPTFLVPAGIDAEARLGHGELIIEHLPSPAGMDTPGAMLHHWRGTAFAPGAQAEDFQKLMRDFNAYPRAFAPQVESASVVSANGDYMQASMRIRQHHVITVVMDTAYDIIFGELDLRHGYSISRSTRMTEIASPGTRAERPVPASEEHGYLWRLNTYWSYEERDGGLYLQVEAVSLTRSVPRGLGWVVGPYVQSIPRESLEFTLRSACNAFRKTETARNNRPKESK